MKKNRTIEIIHQQIRIQINLQQYQLQIIISQLNGQSLNTVILTNINIKQISHQMFNNIQEMYYYLLTRSKSKKLLRMISPQQLVIYFQENIDTQTTNNWTFNINLPFKIQQPSNQINNLRQQYKNILIIKQNKQHLLSNQKQTILKLTQLCQKQLKNIKQLENNIQNQQSSQLKSNIHSSCKIQPNQYQINYNPFDLYQINNLLKFQSSQLQSPNKPQTKNVDYLQFESKSKQIIQSKIQFQQLKKQNKNNSKPQQQQKLQQQQQQIELSQIFDHTTIQNLNAELNQQSLNQQINNIKQQKQQNKHITTPLDNQETSNSNQKYNKWIDYQQVNQIQQQNQIKQQQSILYNQVQNKQINNQIKQTKLIPKSSQHKNKQTNNQLYQQMIKTKQKNISNSNNSFEENKTTNNNNKNNNQVFQSKSNYEQQYFQYNSIKIPQYLPLLNNKQLKNYSSKAFRIINGNIIEKIGRSKYQQFIGFNKVSEQNINSFKVKIIRTSYKQIMIGVVTQQGSKSHSSCLSRQSAYYNLWNGGVWNEGKLINQINQIQVGQTIQTIINKKEAFIMWKTDKIQYRINLGSYLIKKKLFPKVQLSYFGDQVLLF